MTSKRIRSESNDENFEQCSRAISQLFAKHTEPVDLASTYADILACIEEAIAVTERTSASYWELLEVGSCGGNQPTSLARIDRSSMPQSLLTKLDYALRQHAYWRLLESRHQFKVYPASSIPNMFDDAIDDPSLVHVARAYEQMHRAQAQDDVQLYRNLRETGEDYIRHVWEDAEMQAHLWEPHSATLAASEFRALEPLIREAYLKMRASSDLVIYIKSKRCRATVSDHDEGGYIRLLHTDKGPCLELVRNPETCDLQDPLQIAPFTR